MIMLQALPLRLPQRYAIRDAPEKVPWEYSVIHSYLAEEHYLAKPWNVIDRMKAGMDEWKGIIDYLTQLSAKGYRNQSSR